MASTSTASFPQQNFDYFLILDFEATCQDGEKIKPCQEIIEFPVILLDGQTFEEVARFHRYVQPTVCPKLTPFCTDLTGISQEMVDNQPEILEVLQEFDDWFNERNLSDKRFIFVTCGDWDLQTQLRHEGKYKKFEVPKYFSEWINIKESFKKHRGYKGYGMMTLLKEMKLQHSGRHHSGIDDTINIAAITKALAKEGFVFEPTGKAPEKKGKKNVR
ncbi:unnamed protein product, partial [Mesorhabditis belari]|uniref:Exonuclease domain-containing protein n=1 Tax=Mesorhabditis belari TaxID=2138241 RepID=A0AAF3ERL9_9BILA